MANRTFRPIKGSVTRELVVLVGSLTTSTSGAIASSACDGFSVAHASAGVYTVTLSNYYPRLFGVEVTLQAANAPYTAGKGSMPTVASVNLSSRTFNIQFGRTNGTTDYNNTDVEDGASVLIVITLGNTPS